MTALTPLNIGTQGRFDSGSDAPLALGTQGRFRLGGVIPFDPITPGGGTPLQAPDEAAIHRRLLVDDERVIMAVIKKFLEMQRDG